MQTIAVPPERPRSAPPVSEVTFPYCRSLEAGSATAPAAVRALALPAEPIGVQRCNGTPRWSCYCGMPALILKQRHNFCSRFWSVSLTLRACKSPTASSCCAMLGLCDRCGAICARMLCHTCPSIPNCDAGVRVRRKLQRTRAVARDRVTLKRRFHYSESVILPYIVHAGTAAGQH